MAGVGVAVDGRERRPPGVLGGPGARGQWCGAGGVVQWDVRCCAVLCCAGLCCVVPVCASVLCLRAQYYIFSYYLIYLFI